MPTAERWAGNRLEMKKKERKKEEENHDQLMAPPGVERVIPRKRRGVLLVSRSGIHREPSSVLIAR
jgi:hypothetical protein